MFNAQQMVDKFADWVSKYPIVSIEDPLDQNDWDGYVNMTKSLGGKTQIVGDDFFVTNPTRFKKGIDMAACNSILIKVNQIGMCRIGALHVRDWFARSDPDTVHLCLQVPSRRPLSASRWVRPLTTESSALTDPVRPRMPSFLILPLALLLARYPPNSFFVACDEFVARGVTDRLLSLCVCVLHFGELSGGCGVNSPSLSDQDWLPVPYRPYGQVQPAHPY